MINPLQIATGGHMGWVWRKTLAYATAGFMTFSEETITPAQWNGSSPITCIYKGYSEPYLGQGNLGGNQLVSSFSSRILLNSKIILSDIGKSDISVTISKQSKITTGIHLFNEITEI